MIRTRHDTQKMLKQTVDMLIGDNPDKAFNALAECVNTCGICKAYHAVQLAKTPIIDINQSLLRFLACYDDEIGTLGYRTVYLGSNDWFVLEHMSNEWSVATGVWHTERVYPLKDVHEAQRVFDMLVKQFNESVQPDTRNSLCGQQSEEGEFLSSLTSAARTWSAT